MRLINSIPIAVEIMDAHYAIEIKSPCFDKGGAIAAFLSTSTFCGRTPIFVGDDTTDESGFALVSRARRLRLFGRPPAPGRDRRVFGAASGARMARRSLPLEESSA